MGLLGRLFKKGPVRNKEEGSALKRYAKSFFHAIEGFIYCLRYEHNMIIIIIATIMVTIFGFLKPLAKIAKDAASAATLILSITSLIGALIIFIPKIINIL